ncbi:acetoacetate-CoA ligase [Exophiala aquamarina CBS 119918]|uniref:Acetoacetate-CoA ligase n=1 Tax=Exophiala aquamarina CBS 119918 TaxID=1182545 RepID=A0A072P9I4_9EURO|nr:acetoacetate-CoA ligase [Exophiala aquamarina CBS 119918]KEF52225.1 acetoacetate-CoA ligase [Exophiala aquamarina CBS 119918]
MELKAPRKLWEHPNPESTQMYTFMKEAEVTTGRSFTVRNELKFYYRASTDDESKDYDSLYRWSCTHRAEFWDFAFHYFPIVYTGAIRRPVVDEKARIDKVPKWFEGVKLNFAENILFVGDEQGRAKMSPGKENDKIACTEVREGSFLEPTRHTSWKELRRRTGRLSQALRAQGVRKGDRIALVASSCLDTLTVFLATTAIGAIFSSTSPDLGSKGILERLTQIEPKYVFMDDFAVYDRKRIDLRPKMREVISHLKQVPNFKGLISQPRFLGKPADISTIPDCQTWESFISNARSSKMEFEQLDFGDPMIIVYSSGTTGLPKCIVHCVGGVVLSGHKESRLHRRVDHTSTQLQYTTTGWMMYMSSIQLMLMGARTVMYDGSPFAVDAENFIRLVGEQKVTHWGVSPRYLHTLRSRNINPHEVTDLSHLIMVTSTGMVLSESLFEWFYDFGFSPSVQLCNISGGTDIAAAFGTGNPLLPVYVGGAQCISLGMAVSVFDPMIEGGKGAVVPEGTAGELVCTEAFPTMPVKFWGDVNMKRYRSSYFEKYEGVWTHGDFIMVQPQTKQVLFLGRADGVLNPSGVRFGSSDIYNVIESDFTEDISDSICVGQRRPQDEDESVMLFLLMKPGKALTPTLVERVKAAIRKEHTPRHVPRYVFETYEIPMTINSKKVELPVKQIVSGKLVKPSETLANPKSLDYYYQFAKDENLIQSHRSKL